MRQPSREAVGMLRRRENTGKAEVWQGGGWSLGRAGL